MENSAQKPMPSGRSHPCVLGRERLTNTTKVFTSNMSHMKRRGKAPGTERMKSLPEETSRARLSGFYCCTLNERTDSAITEHNHIPHSPEGLLTSCASFSLGMVLQHQLALLDASSRSFASFILDAK